MMGRTVDGGAVVLAEPDRVAALAELRAWLRDRGGEDDAVLAAVLTAAIGLGEAFVGVALIARTVRELLPVSGDWQVLGQMPVGAITLVEGVPAEGAAFALPVDAYAIDVAADGTGHVRVMLPGATGQVRVSYVAGCSPDWAGVAEPVRQGVVMLAGHLLRDGTQAVPPAAVSALWRPYRQMRLR